MSNYSSLKTTINANVTTNGNQEITGSVMNTVLLQMVDILGAGFQYMGVANGSTNPGTPDNRVAYLAGPGSYPRFGNAFIPSECVGVFTYDGEWRLQTTDIGRMNLTPVSFLSNQLYYHYVLPSTLWSDNGYHRHIAVAVTGGKQYKIEGGSETTTFAWLTSHPSTNTGGTQAPVVSGTTVTTIPAGGTIFVEAPATANYMCIRSGNTNTGTGREALPAAIYLAESELDDLRRDLDTLSDQVTTGFADMSQDIRGIDSDLNTITTFINAGYLYKGLADPATDPGTPSGKVFYLAGTPGTYTRFGSARLRENEIGIFVYGTRWELYTISSNWRITNDNYSDFAIGDEDGHDIVRFSEGHVATKQFDSRNVSPISFQPASVEDFSIGDPNDFDIVQFYNGHVRTKKFDSGKGLGGKIFSFLGDSITTFGVPDQNNATGTWTYPGNRCRYPQSDLLTNVNLTWWKRLLDYYGAELGINESWAGSRVSNDRETDSGDLGPNRCVSSLTRIGHLGNNGTPDYIFVLAGTNDAGGGVPLGTFDTSDPRNLTEAEIAALPVVTFADAFRAMLIRLLYYYRGSRVVVLFPNFTEAYYTITDLDKYVEIEREACDFFGVKWIDLRTAGITVYNGAVYLPDGIHPNDQGMRLLFEIVKNSL